MKMLQLAFFGLCDILRFKGAYTFAALHILPILPVYELASSKGLGASWTCLFRVWYPY